MLRKFLKRIFFILFFAKWKEMTTFFSYYYNGKEVCCMWEGKIFSSWFLFGPTDHLMKLAKKIAKHISK
jgi:hypothetical protein